MSACTPREEEITPDASVMLRLEADTVVFDTVFTEVGSVTKRLKVYNPNKNAVKISEIKVGGMGASPFQVFVNGAPGPQVENVELRGKDSLLILVKATINPNAQEQPFLVNDSILFLTNGNQQKVKLLAYGQNAIYYRQHYTTAPAEVWTAAKAHVIYDSVTVPAGQTLTIQKGSQVHLHKNAKIKVMGTLKVEGQHEQRVVFQQMRKEEQYRNAPGQWQGIEFQAGSQNNELSYVELKNAVTGIYLKAEGSHVPRVTLRNAFLKNMLQNGVLSHGGNVRLENSIITNCGQYAFAGIGGGVYTIYFSTLANYSNDFIRTSPSILFQGGAQPYLVKIINSILWGQQEEELQLQPVAAGSTAEIRNSFVKTKQYATPLSEAALQNKINVDPLFRDGPKFDFQLIKLSPANAVGIPVPGITVDYENKPRDARKPDVGALEVDY
jgi:hypothetical protein